MLRLFPWPSPVLHFMRLWLLLLGMETTARIRAPWVPAPKSYRPVCSSPEMRSSPAPLGRCLVPHRGGQEDSEQSKGLEQGNPQVKWIWPQLLRENEPSQWVASIGLTCCSGKAPHHPSRPIHFAAGRSLREGSLILWKAKVTIFSHLVYCFSDFSCLWVIFNFFFFFSEDSGCGF